MALAAWGTRPQAPLMRAQIVGRLLTSGRRSPVLSSWLDVQRKMAALPPVSLPQGSLQLAEQQLPEVSCLVPTTASLTQAGGLHRLDCACGGNSLRVLNS